MIIKFPNNITNTNKDTNTSNKVFNDKEAIKYSMTKKLFYAESHLESKKEACKLNQQHCYLKI